MAALRVVIMFSVLSLVQASTWPWDNFRWPWQSDSEEDDTEAFEESDNRKKFLSKAVEKKEKDNSKEAQEDIQEDQPAPTLSELSTKKVDLEALASKSKKEASKAGIVTVKLNSQLQLSSKTEDRQKSDHKKWGEDWGALTEDLFGWGAANPMKSSWGQATNPMADAYEFSEYAPYQPYTPNAAANQYVQPLQFGQHSTVITQADAKAKAPAATPQKATKGGVVSVKLHSELQTSSKLSKSPHKNTLAHKIPANSHDCKVICQRFGMDSLAKDLSDAEFTGKTPQACCNVCDQHFEKAEKGEQSLDSGEKVKKGEKVVKA